MFLSTTNYQLPTNNFPLSTFRRDEVADGIDHVLELRFRVSRIDADEDGFAHDAVGAGQRIVVGC